MRLRRCPRRTASITVASLGLRELFATHVEGVNQGNAGAQHGRHLAAEERDIGRLDAARPSTTS